MAKRNNEEKPSTYIDDKTLKALGKDTQDELDKLSTEELKARIVQASQAMETIATELQANTKYKAAKDAVQTLSAGKREVDKRQKAIVKYSLARLQEQGKT